MNQGHSLKVREDLLKTKKVAFKGNENKSISANYEGLDDT
jgi:hypothetical protein